MNRCKEFFLGGVGEEWGVGLFAIARVVCYGDRMQRQDAIDRLRGVETELKRLGVVRLFLFGSTARGEARADSDVDLFFDYERGRLGVFELMDVQAVAGRALGQRADVMTRDSLHRTLRERVEASAVAVF